ncbi:hypothetical protein DYBT9275_02554 [Dyadobacter sp. CECT 9275]|uniref:HTH araC/xylS-type domain-containing protein n=1 Tax=Dyadobacter helix TaxID=2822344 RepID=A0A916NLH8_9BACT|nr:helix-turn-helix domain-containing protein [Dyadobacter sp. CECT 9275]CAG5000897.1 hypothetical protein DYBT9275_02554 [Dyadobacter sp. CECT 9275]
MGNWKAFIFLLAFGQGMILSLALIVKGLKASRAGVFMGLILYVLAMELLNAWGMQVHYHSSPDAFPFWIFQSYLILPVSLWFFIQITTHTDYQFKNWNWLLYVPSILEFGISAGWRYYWRYYDKRVPSLLDNPIWFFFTELLPIIGMVVVLVYYLRRLVNLHRQFAQQGMGLSAIRLVRIYSFFTFMVILTLLWICGVVLDWPVFSGVELLITTCLFVLGYTGYANPDFFILPMLPKRSQERSEFSQYNDVAELERLKSAFGHDKIFTQAKLTIDDVAVYLGLPPRYVSYLVNTYCDANFNAFVNHFRVQEVIGKLGNPGEQHKTILALALESGFSSKSSFNQVFRQVTGKSPSQYLPAESKPAKVN